MNTCAVSSCDRSAKSRGWCQTHYMRWYTTGDVEADRAIGHRIKGERARILGNMTVAENGCWLPNMKAQRGGYTYFVRDGGRGQLAHRAAYEILVGPIPAGMHLDHLCHTRDETCRAGVRCPHRKCINPEHLEIVPPAENTRRGRCGEVLAAKERAKTHCPSGHPYDAENTYISVTTGGRCCRECNRARTRARSLRNRGLPDPRRKITDEQIENVLHLTAAGLSGAEISRQTGLNSSSVCRIRNGKQRRLP